MFKVIVGATAFALALCAGGNTVFAASPAPAMMHGGADDVSSIDCSTATAKMTAMMHSTDMAATPADVDHAFAADAAAMMAHEMMLAKIEEKCGKNAKAVAAAKKMQQQAGFQKMVFGTLF